jgi:hypothetical protein
MNFRLCFSYALIQILLTFQTAPRHPHRLGLVVLHLHGDARRVLHQRDQHLGRHQRPRSRTVGRHCRRHYGITVTLRFLKFRFLVFTRAIFGNEMLLRICISSKLS